MEKKSPYLLADELIMAIVIYTAFCQ